MLSHACFPLAHWQDCHLLDRCPEKFVKMGLPTLWVYGDKDWMNEKAGFEMTKGN